uniref:Uncharacterized protein n=1 Tax=Melopsittacus undulatus TaxID=13146 RepID=A0A8V5GPK0_MELUD
MVGDTSGTSSLKGLSERQPAEPEPSCGALPPLGGHGFGCRLVPVPGSSAPSSTGDWWKGVCPALASPELAGDIISRVFSSELPQASSPPSGPWLSIPVGVRSKLTLRSLLGVLARGDGGQTARRGLPSAQRKRWGLSGSSSPFSRQESPLLAPFPSGRGSSSPSVGSSFLLLPPAPSKASGPMSSGEEDLEQSDVPSSFLLPVSL